MTWMTGGSSFTLNSGSASGTSPQDFGLVDVRAALQNNWQPIAYNVWPQTLDIPDNGVAVNTVGAMNCFKVFQSGIPMIMASSGTAGTAGAITAMTAGPTGFWNGPCYLYLPANTWSSNAAGWYYTVLSSTTAGTSYVNNYVSGVPGIPASGNLIANAGAGSGFTGVTSAKAALTFTLPANSLGPNGQIEFSFLLGFNASTNNKTVTIKIGTTTVFSLVEAGSTIASYQGLVYFQNQGATNANIFNTVGAVGGSATAQGFSTIDTTTNQTVTVNITNATATDWTSIDNFSCIVTPG